MQNYITVFFILIILFIHNPVYIGAQSSINVEHNSAATSAMLDIQANTKGFHMLQMAENDHLAITDPANGQFLFQTDDHPERDDNKSTSSMPEWAQAAIQNSNQPCEYRVPIDLVFDGTNYDIVEPGSYYLTGNINLTGNNLDGITIDASNVTLDLNGYTLSGGPNTDDGIFILGDEENIVIKNGIVENWGGDGINAINADQCIFIDLNVRNNGDDGLVGDFNCLIYRCAAEGNGLDGLEADDGSVIANSTAQNNADNGIQVSEGGIVINCTSFNNIRDGIDAGAGSRVENCNVYENSEHGIDLSLGGQVINCLANDNSGNGIDLASSCLAINNSTNDNGQCWTNSDECTFTSGGAGIRASVNAQIINNTCNDNVIGILISSQDSYASDNYCEGNRHAGLIVTSPGSLIIRNRGYRNGYSPIQELTDAGNTSGNIVIDPASTFGPIIDISAAGNIISTPAANHPYANFEY